MSDELNLAIGVLGLVGCAWFGLWLGMGTLQAIAQSNQKTTLTFEGFVGNAFFLLTVACTVYTVVGTIG